MAALLHIQAVDPLHRDALTLLQHAAEDARALYPELFRPDAPPPTNAPAVPGSAYLVAYRGGRPVGCGALLPLDFAAAELRRLFVMPADRRSGVAHALLQALEQQARDLRYRVMRLETGRRQAAAIALYERCGFRPIAPFGPYAGDPMSVCYEKPVAPAQAGAGRYRPAA